MQKNRAIPQSTTPRKIILPEVHTTDCSNGVQLHTINTAQASVVRVTLVFEGGSSSQSKPFEAAATISMLSEGSTKLTSLQIAERLDFYGIFFEHSIDRDYTYLTVATLTKYLDRALDILKQITLSPAFPAKELDVYKSKKKQALLIQRSKPSFIARERFISELFGKDHPYGRVNSHDAYDDLTVDDLQQYYRANIGSNTCFAVASGEITDEVQQQLEHYISQLPENKPQLSLSPPMVTPSVEQQIHRIEREGATQSCIRMGTLLFNNSHPDYIPMQMVAMVLGGYFGSRLVQNLRETHGYTYGAHASMINLKHAGYLALATDVHAAHSQDALKQIEVEISRLQQSQITDNELHSAISHTTGELLRLVDGPFGIADIVIENIQSKKPYDYLQYFLDSINDLTPQHIESIAQKHLCNEKIITVVVG